MHPFNSINEMIGCRRTVKPKAVDMIYMLRRSRALGRIWRLSSKDIPRSIDIHNVKRPIDHNQWEDQPARENQSLWIVTTHRLQGPAASSDLSSK